MEAELAALAKTGAATLVVLMASDSWAQAKGGFARLFARDRKESTMPERLEMSRAEVVAAHATDDDVQVAVIEARWQSRLGNLLRADPAAAQELRRLLLPAADPGPAGAVRNVSSGNVHFGSVIQAGQISGAVFHVSATSGGRDGSQEGNRGDGS
jgi:hypothetical protein